MSSFSSSTPSTTTDATKLVKALLAFQHGDYDPSATYDTHATTVEHDSDLDNEDEEITVAGQRATTTTSSSAKARGKQRQHDNNVDAHDAPSSTMTTTLAKLELNEQPKPQTRALRNLLRSSTHVIELPQSDNNSNDAPQRHELTSWKMADYAYKREPCPFPTRARGLFTQKVDHDQHRIVVRGYDKFFNVGEVSWTHWDAIPKHSSPPYELTLKSNGCIIFIAALTPAHLIVTSKHSVGPHAAAATNMSHSQRGEWWLEKHLAKVGRSKQQLAQELFSRNLTAVAELCDDSFEEHVLAYPENLTGLHLHGLNTNTAVLTTLPSSTVASFAKTWGFIETQYNIFPSVMAVKTYCETVESTGGIVESDGSITPVEGFVVRGVKKTGQPGEPFFWKVKYDEPYLMYREWRELTRKLLHAYPDLDGVNPRKIKNEQSRLYLWWVKRQMQQDVSKFDSWKQGKGIIKTREEFLQWRETDEAKVAMRELGKKGQNNTNNFGEKPEKPFDKTLIVPIAVQGCGKTALGLALSKLYGWGHTQSDDFHMKKPAPHFLKSIKEFFNTHDVVFADKNNHQRKHREDAVATARSIEPKHHVRLVALVYLIDTPELPRDKLHALCAQRIVQRGDRHQTLRPILPGEATDETDLRIHEQAIWQFLGQYEAFDSALNGTGDGQFDHVIELRPEWSREQSLNHVISELKGVLPGVVEPSQQQIEDSISFAKEWTPDKKKIVTKEQHDKKKSKIKQRYFGVKVEADLSAVVKLALERAKDEGRWTENDEDDFTFNYLVTHDRIEKNPHVTLVHENEIKSSQSDTKEVVNKAATVMASIAGSITATPQPPQLNEVVRLRKQSLWDRYGDMIKQNEQSGTSATSSSNLNVNVTLGPRIVWDKRAMTIEVSAFEPINDDQAKQGEIEMPGQGESRHAHVTVGTRDDNIRPVEGKWLLESLIKGDNRTRDGGQIHCIEMEPVKVKGTLAGLR
ncbi:tRNA ligase [Microbotryomycetes sp. JL221]|nr:tRNA ligase [Microbotryomycetes sp. JL221]